MNVVGTITATTTKNNADTAVPFSLPPKFYVQASSDGYINQGGSTVTATSADTVAPQYAIIEVDLVPGNTHIAFLPISGSSSTLKVIAL